MRRPMAVGGAAVIVIMLLGCLVTLPYTLGSASAGGPGRYEATDPDMGLLPPFWARHSEDEQAKLDTRRDAGGEVPRPWLGTDKLGRDVFIRCLAGGGISLGIGLAAAAVAVIIGTVYGTVAGYAGGRVDAVLMRIVDILYGLPYILLVVLLAVAVDGVLDQVDHELFLMQQDLAPGETPPVSELLRFVQSNKAGLNVLTLLVAIGGVSWLTMARVIRGQVLSLREQPFMEACRAIGTPLRRQFLRHLLPNLLGPIIVYATLTVPQAILSESFLSFLGIGVKEPLPSWGNLAAGGLSELNIVRVRWWLLLWPCVFIGISLLALNFFGEALRDAFDPRRARSRASW